jgi:hypothetical protein
MRPDKFWHRLVVGAVLTIAFVASMLATEPGPAEKEEQYV